MLNEHIELLCKRRAQLKKVIHRVVEECFKFIDELTDKAKKIELIEVLRSVSAGKMFVELELARMTRTLVCLSVTLFYSLLTFIHRSTVRRSPS
jgi:26S proteasome regulatory subunit N5